MRWGKNWTGWVGNHRTLKESIEKHEVRVYSWNQGEKATYAVEIIGINFFETNYFSAPGRGSKALEWAWNKAAELNEAYNAIK